MRKVLVSFLVVVLVITSAIILNNDSPTAIDVPDPLLADATAHSSDDDVPYFDENDDDFATDIELLFSHTEHFYESEIFVSIDASLPDTAIFYTLDGAEPSIKSSVYTEPIHIKSQGRNQIEVVTVKAIAAVDDLISRPHVHTYFVGQNVRSRFDTLIFSFSTNEKYLYDHYTGIFVEGITREEYIRTRGNSRNIIPPDPANFNFRGMEAERPVYVEIFEPDGERVIAQAAGMRVHGGWSRAADQKSIRLVARNQYEPGHGKFHYDFFPDDTVRDGFMTPFGKYDQLVLRNGANDRDFGMIRNEVGLELARMTGLEVVSPVRPVSIFLNSEYYGFAWLQVRVNSQYLQDIFNAPTRDFQVIGKGEYWIDSDEPDEKEAIEHFNSFYEKDMTDEAIFQEFNELVDVDQLLMYYAVQTYLGNHDWPNNNIRRWRYTGPQEDGLVSELDGRWRYVAFDLDWILGLYENPANPNRPTFQEMMNSRNGRFSHMLKALFKRPDMVDKFAMIMCDLAASIITEQNVSDLIDVLFGKAQNEISHALAANKYSHWVSKDTVAENHRNMLHVANGRSEYIFRSLRDHFQWDADMFTVSVTGAKAYIGTQRSENVAYFNHLTIPLEPILDDFTAFDHWIVNGKMIDSPQITVSVADAVSGIVEVELVTRESFPLMMFTQAYETSDNTNGCILYNPGSETVYTQGLYLTNNRNDLFLWALPAARVEPGGVLELAGRSSRDPNDLHKIKMGFNVRQGRTLYLVNDSGEIISHIIPVNK